MAQIVTITNPLTGQPTQVDQLEHTAQQIDDAITRSLPGGAIDITLANNDPRRWGLGTIGSPDIQDNDINNLTDNGWYYITGKPKNSPVTYGVIHVSARTKDDLVQTIFSFDDSCQSILRRSKVWGTWKPDEWFNPPMLLGVEYRTTERHNGKPVYAKRIYCESMPAGAGYIDIDPSDTEVPNALISTAIVIRCYGRASVAATIPFYSSANDFMQVGSVQNCRIRIYTAKAYGGTAEITAYYVKTTD